MNTLSGIDLQRQLINALRHDLSPGGGAAVEVIETHISWVVLIGTYAYKIKKALNLGFLDYTTLAQRHHFCLEELRLNRRTAPELYLEVIPVTGEYAHPQLGGKGDALEWAVKMQRFEPTQLASSMAEHESLTPRHIDQLAHTIAEFHRHVAWAEPPSHFGTIDAIRHPIEENFHQLTPVIEAEKSKALLQDLRSWYASAFSDLSAHLLQRKVEGAIRECHGDLHLGNIVIIDDRPFPFDCIEFNDNLRFVDVISEIAFLLMDLDHRQRSDLGWRFLDGYLQESGDFSGLALLRFYMVYRAMVRAKVAGIRAAQPEVTAAAKKVLLEEAASYLQLAMGYTRPTTPRLILTHGFSGSGKSRVALQLLEQWGAIRIRSDVERKRLFGLAAADRSGAQLAEDIYSTDASAKTYSRLAQLAERQLDAGFNVIVDATFLRQADRQTFIQLAERRNVPWYLLDITAANAVLRERIVARNLEKKDASEADLAVLEYQLQNHDPLSRNEQTHCLSLRTDSVWTIEPIIDQLC